MAFRGFFPRPRGAFSQEFFWLLFDDCHSSYVALAPSTTDSMESKFTAHLRLGRPGAGEGDLN